MRKKQIASVHSRAGGHTARKRIGKTLVVDRPVKLGGRIWYRACDPSGVPRESMLSRDGKIVIWKNNIGSRPRCMVRTGNSTKWADAREEALLKAFSENWKK